MGKTDRPFFLSFLSFVSPVANAVEDMRRREKELKKERRERREEEKKDARRKAIKQTWKELQRLARSTHDGCVPVANSTCISLIYTHS